MNKRDYKKLLIQQVHLSRKYREYYKNNKEDYKELLKRSFNVESSTKLDIDSLISLVDFLNYKTEDIVTKNNVKITAMQKVKLLELWETYAKDTSEVALMRFVYAVSKKRFISIGAMDKALASKVIAILIKSLK